MYSSRELNNKIDDWHNDVPGSEDMELYEYLGWREYEYAMWVETNLQPEEVRMALKVWKQDKKLRGG